MNELLRRKQRGILKSIESPKERRLVRRVYGGLVRRVYGGLVRLCYCHLP
ncbi:MAG TPA: hypothetical protein PK874_04970 [Desulfobacteraceae bacterium]|nr:hypothetical protein [Desulfobacteraceae bacterium]